MMWSQKASYKSLGARYRIRDRGGFVITRFPAGGTGKPPRSLTLTTGSRLAPSPAGVSSFQNHPLPHGMNEPHHRRRVLNYR